MRKYQKRLRSLRESWPILMLYDGSNLNYLPDRPEQFRLTTEGFREWFWSRVVPLESGCVVWSGGEDMRVQLHGDNWETADRIAWCLATQHEIGDWLVLVNLCHTPRCVHPKHKFFPGHLRDFYAKTRLDENGCLIWQGSRRADGYGLYHVDGCRVRAHKYAWEYESGIVWDDDRACVCHRCDNRLCVNPQHLFLSDRRGNVADMVAKGRQAEGERHPNARIRPVDTYHILLMLLVQGCSVAYLRDLLVASVDTLRELFRGEHWTQRKPRLVYGELIDLREPPVEGRVVGAVQATRQKSSLTKLEFVVAPGNEDPSKRGRSVRVNGVAFVADSDLSRVRDH